MIQAERKGFLGLTEDREYKEMAKGLNHIELKAYGAQRTRSGEGEVL
jgi:hypothetical protein